MHYRSAPSRRAFIATAAAYAAAPRAAQAQGLTSVRCLSGTDDDVSAVLYAIDSGMFRKAGLDVTIEHANNGAAVAAAVAGGSIDIGKSQIVPLISAHQHGLPFVIVAAAATYNADHPTIAMIVAKDGRITGPKDLPGKIVSVSALNDLNAIACAAYVDAAGGAWRDVRFTETPAANAAEALINHRIDAVTINVPSLQVALDSGKVRVLGHPFDDVGKHFIQAAWFASKDYAAKNPDVVQRFRRVVEQASAYANTHPSATVAPLAAFTKLDPALIARMPRATLGGALDPRLLQPPIDAAFRYGATNATFDSREMLS